MVLETDSQLLATGQSEVEKKSPHYIFFAGSSMEQHSVQPVEKMLTELAGGEKENVTAFTSVLSSEVTKKQRIKEMAQAIEDAFTGKQETTIILYSLGAMEFATALLEMLKTREQKRQKNGEPFQPFELSHIKLVLRSPAGLVRNISDSWRQAREFVGLALSTVTGPHTILETTLNFPPKTSEGALFLEKAYQALLEVFPQVERRSLFRKKVTGRSFAQGILQQQIPGSDHLQDKRFGTIQAEVQKIDSKIWKIL